MYIFVFEKRKDGEATDIGTIPCSEIRRIQINLLQTPLEVVYGQYTVARSLHKGKAAVFVNMNEPNLQAIQVQNFAQPNNIRNQLRVAYITLGGRICLLPLISFTPVKGNEKSNRFLSLLLAHGSKLTLPFSVRHPILWFYYRILNKPLSIWQMEQLLTSLSHMPCELVHMSSTLLKKESHP